jgi:ribose transport system permease protein
MSVQSVRASRIELGVEWTLPLAVITLILFFGIYEPRFLSFANATNVLRTTSYLALAAIGQTMVLIIGGFDLSVGAVVALASVVAAVTMRSMMDVAPTMPLLAIGAGTMAAVGAGAIVGLVNGATVAFLKVHALMVTLGMMSVVTGGALYVTRGVPVYGMPDLFVIEFGRRLQFFGMPAVIFVAIAVIILVSSFLAKTQLGRHLYAVGSHAEAARLSGVKVGNTTVVAHVLCSSLVAIAGVLITARVGSGEATLGASFTLESIAAAVIGGVSLRGGVGKVWRVVFGAALLTILSNGINLMRIDSKVQTAVVGLVLIGAVALERLRVNGSAR